MTYFELGSSRRSYPGHVTLEDGYLRCEDGELFCGVTTTLSKRSWKRVGSYWVQEPEATQKAHKPSSPKYIPRTD